MFRKNLKRLTERALFRSVKDRSSAQGPVISIGGRQCVNFSSNDYLGMAARAEVVKAARAAARQYGAGAGASRLLAGGTELHAKLEQALAGLKRTEAAVLFGSGYAANTGAIPALAGEGDLIISDELNHASLIDGCRLSRAQVLIYGHKDMDGLKRILNKGPSGPKGAMAPQEPQGPLAAPAGRMLVVTDTVFSMDGDVAPLDDIYDICRKAGAMLYLDDAHGTGVLGKIGRRGEGGEGALAHFGLKPEPWVVQMGTLSKALGSFGAFIAASEPTVTWLINNARSFIYSTALPPASAGAALKALELMLGSPEILHTLRENTGRLRAGLKRLGVPVGAVSSGGPDAPPDAPPVSIPIIPVIVSNSDTAISLSRALFERGFYAPAIRPPTVRRPRLRLTVTAAHTGVQIDGLLDALGPLL